MRIAFVLVFLVYLLQALLVNSRSPDQAPRRLSPLTFSVQSLLFCLALYFAVQRGMLSRDLVSPLSIGGGLLFGHFVFGVSLLVTHQELRDAAAHFLEFKALWHFLVENPPIIFRFLLVATTEEIIYRAAAQPLLMEATGWPLLSLTAVALAFSLVHWHFFRNPVVQSAEFLGFALLLGFLYYWTVSLSLVVVIHTLRNLEIVYLEYLVKLDELGDEEQAMKAIETAYSHKPAERA
ncbi:MAG: CPBP family intramembrane metalloprotease [Candidatus Hydrogenedentes bacterium]|nr:CPBP family intramembrane metalloprotease [Candidatus Hydrogenedentota bacterium]MBI3117959.1 CPBP family intramembrane metalloprotease [Candidatus Hydrogenedentota bacterium]